MANATLTVDFLAGSNIEGAFKEAIRLATILEVFIEFRFNDVKCFASPNSNAAMGVIAYNKALKDNESYKFAMS